MSDVASLLPPNATPGERALEQATAVALDVLHDTLQDPARIPEILLPWLAWALSVDEWDQMWPAAQKRAVIAASYAIHKRKGTVGSVKAALAALGLADAEVIEQYGTETLDGAWMLDGSVTLDVPDHWAEFRVNIPTALTNEEGELVRRVLAQVAPARCHLKVIDFTEAEFRLDGTVTLDGTYNLGVT